MKAWTNLKLDVYAFGMMSDGRFAVPVQSDHSNFKTGPNIGATGGNQGFFYTLAAVESTPAPDDSGFQRVSIPRGAGVVPTGCPSTHPSFEGGLCYKTCEAGWSAVGTICYQDCPASGYTNDGLYCGKERYGRGAGYAIWDQKKCDAAHADVGGCEKWGAIWYPKCKTGFKNEGCCFCATDGCPADWEDIGVSCKKPSSGRGVGVARNVCVSNVPELDGGLCYQSCPEGYDGDGPVCWTTEKIPD